MPRSPSDSQRGGRRTHACSIQRGKWLLVGEVDSDFDGAHAVDGLQASGAWMTSDTTAEVRQ